MQLLERTDQLQKLGELLEAAANGSGSLALIGGEAGSGKTSLIRHLAGHAEPGYRVLIGACDPLSMPRPLGPLLDIAPHLSAPTRQLLGNPGLRSDLFTELLSELAGGKPVLMIFEDIHWADEATFDLVRFLGRRMPGTRTLLAATYRDDDIATRHPLRSLLADLAGQFQVHRIAIPPLTLDAVTTLCQDTPFPPKQLHDRTGGNAFYVTEVIASHADGIPPTVRDTVLTHADRLTPSARRVLDAAAIIGDDLVPWLIEAVVPDSLTFIDECLAKGLLVVLDGQLRFRHQLAQQAILEALSPPRAMQLHAAVLAAMRERPDHERDFAALAHHAEASANAEAVLEFAPAAAARASELGAHREAAAQCERALRFCERTRVPLRTELLERLFNACIDTGQFRRAIEAAEELATMGRGECDPAMEARWLANMAKALVSSGRNEPGEEACSRALALIEHLPPGPAHAAVYRIAASIRMLNRELEQTIFWGDKAIAVAREIDDVETLTGTLGIVGSAWIVGGDHARGRAGMEESLAMAQAHGLESLAAVALTNLGSAFGEIYQLDTAERYLLEGIAFTEARDLDGHRLYMISWLAIVRMLQGRWAESTALVEQVLAVSEGNSIHRIMALVALGRVRARRGDPDAWAVLDEALGFAAPTGTLQRLAPVHEARAEAAWLTGNPVLAAAEATAVLDLARSRGHRLHIGELSYWRWLAGDIDQPPADAWEPYLLQMQGNHRAAAEFWTGLGCPYESARALAESNDPDDVREAFTVFDHLDARPAASLAAARLRSLGSRAVPRGLRPATRNAPSHLTHRECEVMNLISAGQTNADIATSLYLSPKTVEHHVTAILRKLNASSRVEAAAKFAALSKTGGSTRPNRG